MPPIRMNTASALTTTLLASASLAQITLDWSTVNGGGGTSAGPTFTVSSTFGQCDAGLPMTSASFAVSGGFWAATGSTPPGGCDSIDFNNDGLFPDTADIDDFLSVFSGGPCGNDPNCLDVDFNNDGLFPDTLDIDSLLSVFSGGPCLI